MNACPDTNRTCYGMNACLHTGQTAATLLGFPPELFPLGVLLLHPYNRDFCESFFECWRFQLDGHAPHGVIGDDAVAAMMTLDADLEGYVEKDGVDFVVVILGQLNPMLAFFRSEIGGVDVVHGPTGDKTRFQHGAQVGKDKILITLFANIVEEQGAQHVAGKGNDVVAFEP